MAEMNLPGEVFTLGRNAVHTTQQFKASPGSVLLAIGAALPDLPVTSSLEDVVEFIYRLKGPDYFQEGGQ